MNEDMTRIETWLPCFPGFAYTLFEPADPEYDYMVEDLQAAGYPCGCEEMYARVFGEHNVWPVEYGEACISMAKELTDAVKCLLAEELFPGTLLHALEYDKIESPKEYNFRNDVIAVTIVAGPGFYERLEELVLEHEDSVAEYLKDHFKSRDGFISFYDYRLDAWRESSDNFRDLDSTQIGSLLEALLLAVYDAEDIEYRLLEWVAESACACGHLVIPDFADTSEEIRRKLLDIEDNFIRLHRDLRTYSEMKPEFAEKAAEAAAERKNELQAEVEELLCAAYVVPEDSQ